MASLVNTARIEKELLSRGLLPPKCRLVEISITPQSALVVRYEVFIESDRLGLFADALKAVADGDRSLSPPERRPCGCEQPKGGKPDAPCGWPGPNPHDR